MAIGTVWANEQWRRKQFCGGGATLDFLENHAHVSFSYLGPKLDQQPF